MTAWEGRGRSHVFSKDFGEAWVGYWHDIRTDDSVKPWAPFVAVVFLLPVGLWSVFTARSHFIFTGKIW